MMLPNIAAIELNCSLEIALANETANSAHSVDSKNFESMDKESTTI